MTPDHKLLKDLQLVSGGLHKLLTSQQILQIQAICDRYARAWQQGQPPSIEAAAAGTELQVRPALLQQLAKLEIEHRAACGATVDLEMYLTRWPDLDRSALRHALDTARASDNTF
ncbi:MAG: hypothetical protein WCO86_03340, partial [Planctomycetota bacterium]